MSPASSFVRAASYLFIYLLGAKVLGLVLEKRVDLISNALIGYAFCILALSAGIITVIFIRGGLDSLNIRVLASSGEARLYQKSVVNPVTLSTQVSIAALILNDIFIRTKSYVRRALAFLCIGFLVWVLLLTGSRGSLFGFVICLLIMYTLALHRGEVNMLTTIALFASMLGSGAAFWAELTRFINRGIQTSSLIEIAYRARYNVVEKLFSHFSWPEIVVGRGAGMSFFYPQQTLHIDHIEVFWAQIIFEWGLIGSILFLLVFIRLTYETYSPLRDTTTGFVSLSLAPFSIFLFMWAITPFYFSFIIFDGLVAVLLGIGSAYAHGGGTPVWERQNTRSAKLNV
jgi:hypothetical protein